MLREDIDYNRTEIRVFKNDIRFELPLGARNVRIPV